MAVLLSQKETWHVYFMNVIFFMNLSINFNSFQGIKKKKKISCVPEPCNSSTMSFSNVVLMVSNSPNPQILFHFLWHLLYSLVNLPLSSFNVLLQTCDINAAEFKGSFQLLSKKFQIYSYMAVEWQQICFNLGNYYLIL